MLYLIALFVIVSIVMLYIYAKVQVKKAENKYQPLGAFITVDGCQLHYISEGTGQPIVFLHGGILSSTDFKEVVHIAAKAGFHAIAFDRPGYGYSERPKNMKFDPNDQAALIDKALEKLHITQPIILVGHSWSGTMTLSYALQFPNKTAGIITLGAVMYKEGYPAEHGDILSKISTTPFIGDIILHTLLKTPLGKTLANGMVKATFAPEEAPNSYKDEVFALGFRPSHFKANREDVLFFPHTSKKLSMHYKDIKTPILIVIGEKDPFKSTQEQASRLQNELNHAELRVLPNIGHMIPELHPKVVLECVNDFAKNFISSKQIDL